MKLNREKLVNDLDMLRGGLSPREFIEQSSCFVFQGGQVMTFNDEVACRIGTELKIEGAVQAAPLLEILSKLDDPELEAVEAEEGVIEFRGKRKAFGLVKDKEVFLPIDRVEIPEKWRSLPKEFTEAAGMVLHCVSSDESRFILTCVHLAPGYVEACDNHQIMRCVVDLGLKKSVLVRGSSLSHLTSLGMSKISLTSAWVHFQNEHGLTYSCRRYTEDYPDLSALLKVEGHSITIPKGTGEASERAGVFASDKAAGGFVTVRLEGGKMRIMGEGVSGWYREVKKVAYNGPALSFLVAPDLLQQISQKYQEAVLNEKRLKVSGGHWEYVTVLGVSGPSPSAEKKEDGKDER